MRFVIGADEERPVVQKLAAFLDRKGNEARVLRVSAWAVVAMEVARDVAEGRADQGIVCCWTGTGACMAANKVKGIRAALCVDAQTAAGARKWNDANVLALSLRLLSEPIAEEILEAWLTTAYDGTEGESLARMAAGDAAH